MVWGISSRASCPSHSVPHSARRSRHGAQRESRMALMAGRLVCPGPGTVHGTLPNEAGTGRLAGSYAVLGCWAPQHSLAAQHTYPAPPASLTSAHTCHQVQVLAVVEDVPNLVGPSSQQATALGMRACRAGGAGRVPLSSSVGTALDAVCPSSHRFRACLQCCSSQTVLLSAACAWQVKPGAPRKPCSPQAPLSAHPLTHRCRSTGSSPPLSGGAPCAAPQTRAAGTSGAAAQPWRRGLALKLAATRAAGGGSRGGSRAKRACS